MFKCICIGSYIFNCENDEDQNSKEVREKCIDQLNTSTSTTTMFAKTLSSSTTAPTTDGIIDSPEEVQWSRKRDGEVSYNDGITGRNICPGKG